MQYSALEVFDLFFSLKILPNALKMHRYILLAPQSAHSLFPSICSKRWRIFSFWSAITRMVRSAHFSGEIYLSTTHYPREGFPMIYLFFLYSSSSLFYIPPPSRRTKQTYSLHFCREFFLFNTRCSFFHSNFTRKCDFPLARRYNC